MFLMGRDTFWMVVRQSVLFTVVAVLFKALIGFVCAHLIHNVSERGQRVWRGLMLVPWVIPPALSTLGWWWLFDPTYSAINWLLVNLGGPHIPWLSRDLLGALRRDPGQHLVRRAVLHDHVSRGAQVDPGRAL